MWQAEKLSSRQPAERKGQAEHRRASGREVRAGHARERADQIAKRRLRAEVLAEAPTRGDPERPVVPRLKIEVSAGGACGAKRCQADSAALAWLEGQETANHDAPVARAPEA